MPRQQRWTLKRILGAAGLLVTALLFLAFTEQVSAPMSQAAMFVAAMACLVGALWPHYGLSLLLAGVMALSFDKTHLDAPSMWNITFLILFSAGAGHLLRRHPLLCWIGISLPCWAMASAVPCLMYVAMGLTIMSLVLTSVRPLLSRARRTGITPLPHLANGPLIDVPQRIYVFKRSNKLLEATTVLCGLAVLAGGVLWLAGVREGGLFLVLTAGILGLTFGFSLWFTARMYFQVDSRGIHSRVLFGVKSVPWTELGGLFLRYVFFPGFNLKYVYYRVLSPSQEITFPNTMTGAGELRELIEKAVGMKWPEPEIRPTSL